MADQWYYARNSQKHGPLTGQQLKQAAATGQLQPTDMVWKEGMQKWIPASSVTGLFQPAQPAAAVPPKAAVARLPRNESPTTAQAEEVSAYSRPSPHRSPRKAAWLIAAGGAGVCIIGVVILVVVLSGKSGKGGTTSDSSSVASPAAVPPPDVPQLDLTKGPNGEQLEKVERKRQVFMAFRDKNNKLVRHGRFMSFWDSDKTKKSIEGDFFAGEWHGKVSKWHQTGELYSEGVYDRGRRVGTKKWYKKNGQVAAELRFDNQGLPLFKEASTDAFVRQLADFLGRDRWDTNSWDAAVMGELADDLVLYPKNRPPLPNQYTITFHDLRANDRWPYSELMKSIGKPHRIVVSPSSKALPNLSSEYQIWIYECKDGIVRFRCINAGMLFGRGDTTPQPTDKIGSLGVFVGGPLP